MPDPRPALTHDEARAQFICAAEPLALDLQQLGYPAQATLLQAVARELDAAPALSHERARELEQMLERGAQIRLLRESPDFQLLRQAVQVLGAPERAPAVGEPLRPAVATGRGARPPQRPPEEPGLLDIRVKSNPVSSFASNFTAHYQASKALEKPAAPESAAAPARPAGVGEGSAPSAAPAPPQLDETAAPVTPSPALERPTEPARPPVAKLPGLASAAPVDGPAGFTAAELPWPLLERLGLGREQLEASGQLPALLRGDKTALLPLRAAGEQAGGEVCHLRARLVLRRTGDGAANLQFELPREQLVIPEQLHGTVLGPQVRQQLLETGRGPRLSFQLPDGQELRAYVGVDREMNRLVLLHEHAIRLPEAVRGVALSAQQRAQLAAGLPVALQGLVHQGTGARYDATVQIDAARRALAIQWLTPGASQEPRPRLRPSRG